MVVPESSARLEYPAFNDGLNGNHLTIAKYSSQRDPNFTKLANKLGELVESIVEETETLPETP